MATRCAVGVANPSSSSLAVSSPEHQLGVAPHEQAQLGEDPLRELDLAPHAHPFPRRHREGAGDEAGESGQPDRALRRRGARQGEDQGEVGDEPVVDTEDGGAGTASGHGIGSSLEVGRVAAAVDDPGSIRSVYGAPERRLQSRSDSLRRSLSTNSAWPATSVTA